LPPAFAGVNFIPAKAEIHYFSTYAQPFRSGFQSEFIPVKAGTGMTEEGHFGFHFRKDKLSFLRKQESIWNS